MGSHDKVGMGLAIRTFLGSGGVLHDVLHDVLHLGPRKNSSWAQGLCRTSLLALPHPGFTCVLHAVLHQGRLKEFFMGSVSRYVVHHCKTPVVIVRNI